MTKESEERYSHGYGVSSRQMAERTAFDHLGFFIPYLHQDMNVLDCGCGPGTIAVSIAKDIVSSGHVTGIDLEESQIELARAHALEQEVSNIQFEVASIYEIPFPDESFDAVLAHHTLQHVMEPHRALRELFRVLKPGGVVGVREEDHGSMIVAPHTPIIERAMELYWRFWRSNGGNPNFARRHKAELRKAGFTDIRATASSYCWGTPEETKAWGDGKSKMWLEPVFADRVIELGWVDKATLEEMSTAAKNWGEHPDAYWAYVVCEAVGWKN